MRPFAALMRRLQSRRYPRAAVRLAGAMITVPVILAVFVIARSYGLLRRRPLCVEGRTLAGWSLPCRLPDLVEMYVYLFGVWEPDISHYVSRRLEPGRTFVDVGAHVGYYTLLAANLTGPGGKVVSVEASPRMYSFLVSNIAAAGVAEQVRPVAAAAGGEAGSVTVYRGREWNTAMSSTQPRRGQAREAEMVTLPLDEILSAEDCSAVQLLKIDVEGAEESVIAGMQGLLHEGPDDLEILLELSPCYWPDRKKEMREVVAPLLAAGFLPYRLDNDYWPWRYLRPDDVRPPRRVRGRLEDELQWPGQVDIVFSRRDQDEL